jgi:hypothetical protein
MNIGRITLGAAGLALSLVATAGLLGGSSLLGASASASEMPEGAVFVSVTPQRLFDTRDGVGFGGASSLIAADSDINVQVTGAIVPAGAVGVAMNVTYVDATGAGFITIYPKGEPMPGTSNLNKVGPGPVANYVSVRLSADGRLAVHNNGGATHLVGDVLGYYVPGTGAPGPQGPAGAPGAQGPQGVPGPQGVVGGYEIVSEHIDDAFDGGIAECPDGKKVLGGSYDWDFDDPHAAVPSHPAPDGSGWVVDSGSFGFGDGGTIYAICAVVAD